MIKENELLWYNLCLMTCICDLLNYSILDNVFTCNVKTGKTCFEKSEVLNDFIEVEVRLK